MKATFNIPEPVLRQLKQEAARKGQTMSYVVEAALRFYLNYKPAKDLPPLPSHDMGEALVDVADREALYKAMGGRW